MPATTYTLTAPSSVGIGGTATITLTPDGDATGLSARLVVTPPLGTISPNPVPFSGSAAVTATYTAPPHAASVTISAATGDAADGGDYLAFDGTKALGLFAKAGGPNYFPSASACSVTVRFRTSNATTRGILWVDSVGAGNDEWFLDVNSTGNLGKLRWTGDGGAPFFQVVHATTVTDGAWHTVTCVKAATNLHRWFVDGAQVGADITTDLGAVASFSGVRALGAYRDGTTIRLVGDLGTAAWHDRAITLAEHQAMHAGGSPLGVSGAACELYPCGPAACSGHGEDHTAGWPAPGTSPRPSVLLGGSPRPVATAGATVGASGLAPRGAADLLAPMRTGALIAPGAAASSDAVIREIGNSYVLADGTHALTYTGETSAGANTVQVHLATSPDGVTWTKQGVILAKTTIGYYTEDPYVMRDGAWYYLYCENRGTTAGATHVGIALFRSADGLTGWTSVSSSILPAGGVGSWEERDVSSPCAWREGSTYHLLYEGRVPLVTAADTGKVGHATATDPAGPWTKAAGNPVFTTGAAWDAQSAVPDDVRKVGGTYYLFIHGRPTPASSTDYRTGLLTATDPAGPWAESAQNPLTDIYCNTMMFASWSESVAYGVQEAAPDSGSIVRYDLKGAYAAPTLVDPAPVALAVTTTVYYAGAAQSGGSTIYYAF